MAFNIVEIPENGGKGSNLEIVVALQNNIGKAIEVPVEEGKNPDILRKTIRSSTNARGLLRSNYFRTRSTPTSLIIWLEPKVAPAKE